MYRGHMPKMIQLRHVPDGLHRRLKARAALEGMSLSDYLVREVRKIAERPTMEEIRARLGAQAPVQLNISPTRALREEREQR
jgi:plasmid stability protein